MSHPQIILDLSSFYRWASFLSHSGEPYAKIQPDYTAVLDIIQERYDFAPTDVMGVGVLDDSNKARKFRRVLEHTGMQLNIVHSDYRDGMIGMIMRNVGKDTHVFTANFGMVPFLTDKEIGLGCITFQNMCLPIFKDRLPDMDVDNWDEYRDEVFYEC